MTAKKYTITKLDSLGITEKWLSREPAAVFGGVFALPLLYFALTAVGLPDAFAQLVACSGAFLLIVHAQNISAREAGVDQQIRSLLDGKPSAGPVMIMARMAFSIKVVECIVSGVTAGVLSVFGVADDQHWIGGTFVWIYLPIITWMVAQRWSRYLPKRGFVWIIAAIGLSRLLAILMYITLGAHISGLDTRGMVIEFAASGVMILLPASLGYLIGRRNRARFMDLQVFSVLPDPERAELITLVATRRLYATATEKADIVNE
jgi:hypothetical protein